MFPNVKLGRFISLNKKEEKKRGKNENKCDEIENVI